MTVITPHLKAKRTISHPDDPALVVGFQGRDVILGRDAVILKAQELPNTDSRVGLPPEVPGGTVYILTEEKVYVEESDCTRTVHTFTEGPQGIETCPSLEWAEMVQYDREEVEISA